MDIHEFENLNPEEQKKIFHQSSFKEKGELIFHSHEPEKLTRSLSQEELFLLTREMDLDERAELLRYASLPQLSFMADLDCWKKDRLDGDAFIGWLETLLKAEEKKCLAWLLEMDPESAVSAFRKVIEVIKPDHEWASDEILGDTPFFTLDGMYYILVTEENMETVKRAIEMLFENHRGRYTALLESLLSELGDEVEEEAFRQREVRLSERGFPDMETAQKIYRPITAKEFEEFPRKNLKIAHETAFQGSLPNYPVLWNLERFFLDDVLHCFAQDTSGVREGLEEELAWLSNKIIASGGIDFSSEERVRLGIERARNFLNLGLEDLSKRDILSAAELLKTHWLEIIFRWGMTLAGGLREQALKTKRTYWGASSEEFLGFLDEPYQVIFQGAFKMVPEYYDTEQKGETPLRDFKKVEDLERCRISLLQIEKMLAVLKGRLGEPFEDLARKAGNQGYELTLFSLLGTLAASWAVYQKFSIKPLEPKEMESFIHKAFDSHGKKRSLKKEFKAAFPLALIPEEKDLFVSFWAVFFERLEEEFESLRLEDGLDPRFVSLVFIKASKSAAVKRRIPRKKRKDS